MTVGTFSHLNLHGWPFHVVASPSTADVWVGRPAALKRLHSLQRSAKRVRASQVVVLWATFGSGKTHALLHLRHLVTKDPDVTAVYVVAPKGIKSFVDIYRAIIDAALNAGTLQAAGRSLFERTAGRADSDIERALLRLGMFGDDQSTTAVAWIRGERVPMSALRQIGIGGRIETTTSAIDALNRLVPLLQEGGDKRLMVLLDEVQEFEELGRRLPECVGGLHKVFDQNTEGLTMVLSFTTANRGSVAAILGETLYDRASVSITLPAMSEEEAKGFVEELITAWSIDSPRTPFPFTRKAIEAVVAELEAKQIPLTPRSLIKAFDQVLRECEADIEAQELEVIGPHEALTLLDIDEA